MDIPSRPCVMNVLPIVWNSLTCMKLATFHPQYRFEGSEEDDASNYTNRSPYPVLHLLLEDQVRLVPLPR